MNVLLIVAPLVRATARGDLCVLELSPDEARNVPGTTRMRSVLARGTRLANLASATPAAPRLSRA